MSKSANSGEEFASLTLKIVLSTLLRKFEFNLSPDAKRPKPTSQIILKPVGGINLLVTGR